MPIKWIVSSLALATIVCFAMQAPAMAVSEGRALRTISTTPDLGLGRVKYRVVTTGTTSSGATSHKPKDTFRISCQGLQLQNGDQVSFTLEGPDGTVDIGSPTFTGTNAALTITGNRSRGTIGASPYTFPNSKITVNSRRSSLTFLSGRGVAQATPALTDLGVVENVAIDVIIHVRRSGDGDYDFTFSGQFRVRHNFNRRQQLHIYRGELR